MGESEEKEFIRMTRVQRAEALRAEFEEDLQTAWERGREAGKEEGFAEGELRGLVGPRELPRLWTRHLANSAAVVDFLPRRGAVADVGSGAGFPGVVIALLRPDLEVTLIEPMERRIDWLTDVVAELDLANAVVRRARAQEVRDRFDAVTARAVAGLPRLVRITAPLLRPGGRLLALKGARAQDEVDEARRVIKGAGLEPAIIHDVVTPGGESTRVVEIRRRRSG